MSPCSHEPEMTEPSQLPGGNVSGPFPIQVAERSGFKVYICRHCGLLYAHRQLKEVTDGREEGRATDR